MYAVAPVPQESAHSTEEIKTVLVAGLPGDATDVAVHNLFRLVAGYESCNVIPTPNGGVCIKQLMHQKDFT